MKDIYKAKISCPNQAMTYMKEEDKILGGRIEVDHAKSVQVVELVQKNAVK